MRKFLRRCSAATVLFIAPIAFGAPPPRDQVKWLVTPIHRGTPLPPSVAAAGARLLMSYPDVDVLALPAVAREHVGRLLENFEITELDELIRTPRRNIDPRIERAPRAPFEAGLFLLQFTVPPIPAWQAQLRDSQIITVDTLPERSIIVVASESEIAHLEQLPWLQYVGPYLPEYKFAPVGAAEEDEFLIQIANTPRSQATIARIRDRVGAFLAESPYDRQTIVHVKTKLSTAQELLSDPFVLGIEKFTPQSASDERQALSVTGATTPVNGDYLQWLAQRGITPNQLTSSGIVVDVADTGLDVGCISGTGHPDLFGRKAYLKAYGSLSVGTDSLRHGTVVAGIVGGNPVAGITMSGAATSGTGMKDSDSMGSFYYGLGVAPGVRVASTQMMGSNFEGTVADWTRSAVSSRCNTPAALCTDTAALCRAVVQNHSHNEYDSVGSNAGKYTLKAREFDISVRNADRSMGVPLAITIAAGNYAQYSTDPTTLVMASATAKNVIAVGAAESARDTIPTACQNGSLPGNSNPLLRNAAGGYDVLAYSSRRGTLDGRIKPDFIAPATLVTGPRPHVVGGGTYCFSVATDPNYPEYHGASGTSWAAPVGAGAIALLRYQYGALSPAMYKAMLVGGARSITGKPDRQTNGTVTAWPNAQQGFGVISLADLLTSTPAKSWNDQGTVLTQGQIYERTVTVSDPSRPVRIALVWTDKEASPEAPITLVNNLDLMSYGPDKPRFLGNYTDASGFSRSYTACVPPCTSPTDVRNNVEVININPTRFSDPANRTFTVRVTAASLNGIAVPGQSGGANNQDFALFVLNGTMN